ncbi:hypothetical protein [Pontibacillus sp. HMF3514]|uniref:hypothetical protein n=1 Tax=Pontibacillus sp. HMF3514 TaxID=2692425 RepID=UPI001F3141E8|nr:hypothetical protein [Pontibacillus sp. HMF3514]
MKLLYQLNAAFTALLIIIMSVTGFFMYSLIMDVLVTNEQKDLRVKGEFLLNVMYQENYSARGQELRRVIESNDLRVLVMDPDENQIMFSSLPLIHHVYGRSSLRMNPNKKIFGKRMEIHMSCQS